MVLVNLHQRSTKEGMITEGKKYIGSFLESVILKLEINGMNMSQSVLENEDYKILWDFSIQTDHVIETQRPDLVVVDKERSCKIIDFAVPGDRRIEEKEKDKIGKYQDLGRELRRYGM